jgi:hypothetical protein
MKIHRALWAAILLASASSALQSGKLAPDFSLQGTDGKTYVLKDLRGKYVVLEWVNHGCPFVKKHYDSGNMQALQKKWTERGVVWLSVCSSAEGKQGYHSASDWKVVNVERRAAATAVLLDEPGAVGKLYGAKTTPHMFVIDPKGRLIYQGAIDNKPSADPEDVKGAWNFVSAALEEGMAGRKVTTPSTKAYGCSVKYK